MKESEIRPKQIFEEYLALCRRDIERFYGDNRGFAAVNCPACDSSAVGDDGFTKLGFRYEDCAGCGTLYVSPRPTPAMQESFARQSEATVYWSTHFYRETAEARRERSHIGLRRCEAASRLKIPNNRSEYLPSTSAGAAADSFAPWCRHAHISARPGCTGVFM